MPSAWTFSGGLVWLMLMVRIFVFSCLISVASMLRAQTTTADLATAMSTRYAPYANWERVVDVELLSETGKERYGRSVVEIREQREEGAPPLAGLHLALDPGHIGGRWAYFEGRNFKINPNEHEVREGELVLEVAQRVRDQLEELGAQVTLLREGLEPINSKSPFDYLDTVANQVAPPEVWTNKALYDYFVSVRNRAVRLSVVVGEIAERARRVNEAIQPDALLSLHINAAPWPKEIDGERAQGLHLVESNHVHVLIFGCMSDDELCVQQQQEQLAVKLLNGSGPDEHLLATYIGEALQEATRLPASKYRGENAVLLDSNAPTVWARNLMMLRMVECPTVLLEPYVANSKSVYPRIQAALQDRDLGRPLAEDDILIEYANAVVAGVLRTYGDSDG
ncbi:MAG: N-acetylmuramoyl-L-alanine amidase family protein [Lentimonas sp.]